MRQDVKLKVGRKEILVHDEQVRQMKQRDFVALFKTHTNPKTYSAEKAKVWAKRQMKIRDGKGHERVPHPMEGMVAEMAARE